MMAPTSTASRKRKTAGDMDESPPKRQTRARTAKATETSTTSTAPKTTRITTASARIAAEAKIAATKSTAKTTTVKAKRVTRATDDKKETEDAPKSRTRTKKAAVEDTTVAGASKAKPSTRVTKAPNTEKKTDVLPATRTRKPVISQKSSTAEPIVKRTTRARSATMESEATLDAPAKQPETKKVVKRVTFQEDLIQDKENKPLPTVTKKEPAKSSGIKARPVRQPTKARTTTTTRGKKTLTTIEEKVTPLSPRKITQVAKSSSSSEDELARTPLKKVLKSPGKPTILQSGSPVRSSQESTTARVSENKTEDLLASPAKRPPPSPFKDALNQSPKKFPPPTMMPDLRQTDESTDNTASLRLSPKKFDFTPVRSAADTRRNMGDAARAALLGSPARRPNLPLNFGSARLPEKIGPPTTLANTTSIMRHVKNDSLFSATPRRLFGSPRKNAPVPTSPIKAVNTAPEAESEPLAGPEDPTISEAHAQTPFGFKKYSNSVRFADVDEAFEHDAFEESGQYRSVDDVSEDELSLGPVTTSPSKGLLLARRLASSPSAVAPTPRSTMRPLLTPKSKAKDQFMTPLAIQFGGWLATSPTRSESAEDSSTEIYTPVAEVLHNRNENRRVSMTPASKPSYFEDQLPQVNATPENSMQEEDLHTDEDLEMVEAITSGITVVAATPEENLQGIPIDQDHDMNMPEGDHVEIIADSFEIVPELLVDGQMEAVIDDAAILEESAPAQIEFDDTQVFAQLESSDNVDQEQDNRTNTDDCTVIITREAPSFEAAQIESVSETPLLENFSVLSDIATPDHSTEDYGDENAIPVPEKITEAKIELPTTPVRAIRTRSKEVRTVARVPLKPASSDTPAQIKVRKGRSKSMSAPLSELELTDDLLIPKRCEPTTIVEMVQSVQTPARTPRSVSQPFKTLDMPEDDLISLAGSPFKSVRKGSDAQILRGAVVHVDVHTSEGSDASGIFIELLTQMGAKCIKQWNWNSRSTLGGGEDPSVNSKVGITHVVFKDGSKRTLQKVREAKGLVLCVGVGWVLDCERTNRWLDEAPFAVDTSTIPRGGRNRRKSMEPKMLANLGGDLVPAPTPAKSTRKSVRLSAARESIVPAAQEMDETVLLPFTPGPISSYDAIGVVSTPLLVTENTKLVQQTCPPKQSQPNLFPLSGNLEDQPDDRVRERLAKARRKTMAWAPKVASPLGRDMPQEF